jgi:toxin ParE1/3/4
MRAHFTPQAEIDLEEVGDYIALDNPLRTASFIREIRQHCENIADGPHHYVSRPDLGDAIRICAHGNYLIVFEPFDDGALILRVLHGARNVPGVLGGY